MIRMNLSKQENKKLVFSDNNFLITILLIYFICYGIIANNYGKDPDEYLLYIYLNFRNLNGLLILLTLVIIFSIQSYFQNSSLKALQINFWTLPFFIIISLILYSINYQNYGLEIFISYFISLHCYINLIILIGIIYISTIFGRYLRLDTDFNLYIKKIIKISVIILVIIGLFVILYLIFDVFLNLINKFIQSL